jgi:prepilin-type processing-associated H-X9-DG protein
MNGFMNPQTDAGYGGDGFWNVFHKTADLRDPPPVRAFAFVDEHEDSVDDGFFRVTMGSEWPDTAWSDLPASRHNRGVTFSFADGHAEVKRWTDARTPIPVTRQVHSAWTPSKNNPDVVWLQERSTSRRRSGQ